MGRKQGISVEKLLAVASWREAPDGTFDERERLVLAFADAMTRTPVDVPDALFASLRACFGEAELVELSTTIAWENFRARQNRAFLVESDQLSENAACALPRRGGQAA